MAATATAASASASAEPSSPSHAQVGQTPRFFGPVPRGQQHLHHGHGQRADHLVFRPPPPPRMPFFVREIYKNGFLKRLPYSEKKSSALSKLMRSDRYWVVFSVHDDLHPFLELWNEPTEVVSKPPHYIFPLALCQHISPCIIPADSEWSFVVTFETVAVRFSCNSRQTMEEWVECLRRKLGDMGLLNAKGNLYTKIPSGNPKVSRNPRSPLPSPPRQEARTEVQPQPEDVIGVPSSEPGSRLSIVDASDQANATFTTSIYLNQNSASSSSAATAASPPPSATGARPKTCIASTLSLDSSMFRSYETLPDLTCPSPTGKSTSSVYLNKANETRHVTVIPINKAARKPSSAAAEATPEVVTGDVDVLLEDQHPAQQQHPTPTRNPQMPKADLSQHRHRSGEEAPKTGSKHQSDPAATTPARHAGSRAREARRNHSPSRRQRKSADLSDGESLSPPAEKGLERRHHDHQSRSTKEQQQRVKKRSQRSSSLGPLQDDEVLHAPRPHGRGANTNSLESLDSNPRQAAARVEHRGWPPSRRPQPPPTDDARPPPAPAFPPHVPLPGLTCQLSLSLPPGLVSLEATPLQRPHNNNTRGGGDQHVLRLRQEMAHPAGVRLVLRRRDCHGSLALAEFLGCVWVAGWRQREFPVLHNAFHVGDQIVSASGVAVRSAADFHRLVKAPASKGQAAATAAPQSEHHVEVIIRRLPLAQVFHLRREAEGQPLGIVTNGGSAEIRDVVASSVAGQRGLTPKVRSFEGQTLVPRVITEVNGCPVGLFAKDGEAGEKLQAVGTEVSLVVLPLDFVSKMRKQLKASKSYKDFVLS